MKKIHSQVFLSDKLRIIRANTTTLQPLHGRLGLARTRKNARITSARVLLYFIERVKNQARPQTWHRI